MKNTQVLLARRPVGRPVQEDFRVIESEVPPIRDGEALLENQFISLDAGFRNWMNEDAGDEVLPAMSIDEPVMGLVAATVAESKRDDLTPGQVIVGRTAWEAFSIALWMPIWMRILSSFLPVTMAGLPVRPATRRSGPTRDRTMKAACACRRSSSGRTAEKRAPRRASRSPARIFTRRFWRQPGNP